MSRERKKTGQYAETTQLADVLDVFDAVAGPIVTSADVADALDCSRETARRKLRELEADGRTASRKTAGRVVWWRVERSEPGDIDPSDPFWDLEPGTSGETDTSERVDEVLYGEST